jgi:hypothetical protein
MLQRAVQSVLFIYQHKVFEKRKYNYYKCAYLVKQIFNDCYPILCLFNKQN